MIARNVEHLLSKIVAGVCACQNLKIEDTFIQSFLSCARCLYLYSKIS